MNLFAPFNSDGYKLAHAEMYATGTQSVYSNLTPRSDRIYRDRATQFYDGKLVFVGCQGAIIEIVENWQKFFKMPKGIAIAQFKFYCDNYLGPDAVPTDSLAKLHDLGYLPLRIRTLDEGTKVPMGVPVLTITNTVDHAYWLVNFLETTISNLTWKPSTVATIATEYKRMMLSFAEKTGVAPEFVDFQGHSFACRGMSGPEDSARSEFGHIASFLGTDSLGSIMYAHEYYGAKDFVAASVPATEHAVATSNILRIEEQLLSQNYAFINAEHREIFDKMVMALEDPRLIAEIMFMYELMQKFPTGILSYVADSFDFWKLLTNGLVYLKEVIERRESNGITPGKLVIRPDTGVPEDVVCGKPEGSFRRTKTGEAYGLENWNGAAFVPRKGAQPIDEAEIRGAIELLMDIFGSVVNEKGYRELPSCIGLIYGDSITPQRCLTILDRLEKKGIASSACVFGVGSYTYQCNTRDSFGFAVKATNTVVNGKSIPIFKDPKTDSKKKSAKGLLYVARNEDGEYSLIDNASTELEDSESNELKIRFENGRFLNQTTLEVIRGKLQQG